MVKIPDNFKVMTDEEFDAWWAKLSPEKQAEWLAYSQEHLVKR